MPETPSAQRAHQQHPRYRGGTAGRDLGANRQGIHLQGTEKSGGGPGPVAFTKASQPFRAWFNAGPTESYGQTRSALAKCSGGWEWGLRMALTSQPRAKASSRLREPVLAEAPVPAKRIAIDFTFINFTKFIESP